MNKRIFLRITAYIFLALAGLSAWDQYQSGWRHYLGLAFFFIASIRIFILLFPGKKNRETNKEQPKD
jgi:hypothetical protein